MPKSKKQQNMSAAARANRSIPVTPGAVPARRGVSQNSNATTGLVMGAIVAVGCWFVAYTFTLQESPNRYLFAGMMAMIALMWSISFYVRLRKWQRRRQTN
ncbi:hypothetical protein [Dictyobacter kobayashii]|uniref:hypothetical protein n=1 Tax=Dictyobacter kobayashii TaxID=2014872 RepID=UPI000F84C986|nr:hypothetical protein [Dictyobacter kobayashii]